MHLLTSWFLPTHSSFPIQARLINRLSWILIPQRSFSSSSEGGEVVASLTHSLHSGNHDSVAIQVVVELVFEGLAVYAVDVGEVDVEGVGKFSAPSLHRATITHH